MRTKNTFLVQYYQALIILTVIIIVYATQATAQDFTKYHTYNEMTDILQRAVKSHKNISRMESIGTTLENREIWLVEIAGKGNIPVEDRQAVFIGANFEGNHLIGSELSLFSIDYLLSNYNSDQDIKEKIDKYVFYFLPKANPDGAERMFGKVITGLKTNMNPLDDDNDARVDEDGPEDLNVDGVISMMRVKDPEGAYMINPDDPRLMKKADPKKSESGVYKLYWEGTDNDGDGFINEDSPGGVDINRNFQHEYPYYTKDAGRHMVSERETRAIMDWIISKRNVALILTYGESDNLIVSPDDKGEIKSDILVDLISFADESNNEARKVGMFRTGGTSSDSQNEKSSAESNGGKLPETTVNEDDVEYFKMIGSKYREMTGLKKQPPVREPKGAFFQYGYYQYGIPSFSTPGWGIPESEEESSDSENKVNTGSTVKTSEEKEDITPDTDKILLKWMDSLKTDGFTEWSVFEHPDLGAVEIGGFKPGSAFNPPSDSITVLGQSHAEFTAWLPSILASVKIVETEIVSHGGNIFGIRAVIENKGILPTALAHGIHSQSVKPVMVQLGIDPEAIISGNNKTSFIPSLDGSGGRQEFKWIVSTKPGTKLELKAQSQKGGSDIKNIILK
ncbi:M14 family metallopeptidase [Candidatus Latescibacterota bacterium]